MSDHIKKKIKDYLERNYPQHLGGYEEGWLEIEYREIENTDWSIITIYTNEGYKKPIGTILL